MFRYVAPQLIVHNSNHCQCLEADWEVTFSLIYVLLCIACFAYIAPQIIVCVQNSNSKKWWSSAFSYFRDVDNTTHFHQNFFLSAFISSFIKSFWITKSWTCVQVYELRLTVCAVFRLFAANSSHGLSAPPHKYIASQDIGLINWVTWLGNICNLTVTSEIYARV